MFVVPLLLLAAGVGFLLLVFDEENVLLWKYNQSRITQARDKQVDEDQDPPGLTLIHSAILRCELFVFGSHRCSGGMACGAEVTAMSHGIFLLS